jgi:hypothetical protein
MDWMGLEKIMKKFDLFGIQTHPIPLNPHGLRANRTSPKLAQLSFLALLTLSNKHTQVLMLLLYSML